MAVILVLAVFSFFLAIEYFSKSNRPCSVSDLGILMQDGGLPIEPLPEELAEKFLKEKGFKVNNTLIALLVEYHKERNRNV